MTDNTRWHDGDDPELRSSLRALAEAEGTGETGRHVEAVLLAAWDIEHRPSSGHRWTRRAWLLPVAAALALAIASSFTSGSDPLAPRAVREETGGDTRLEALPRSAADASVESFAGALGPDVEHRVHATHADLRDDNGDRETVVLAGGPLVSGEALQILRLRIDRDTLASIGLRSLSAPADADMVDIEMLIGEDGVARGLRVLE